MLFYDNFYGQINFIYFTVEFISVKSNKSKLSVYYMRIFALYSHHNSLAATADWAVHIAPRLRSILRACHFAAFREGSFGARMKEDREGEDNFFPRSLSHTTLY